MTIKDMERAVGGLSRPSKMPGFAYGLSADDCIVGSLLRKVGRSKGIPTSCGTCYAKKGMYVFPNVKRAHENRAKTMENLSQWTTNMIVLLRTKYRNKKGKDRVFRWHDSGDVQSMEHISAIMAIAEELSDIKFWVPTQEKEMFSEWLAAGNIMPKNVVVRLSAAIIGKTRKTVPGLLASTINTGNGFACKAPKQGGECKNCRACWNPEIPSIDYKKH